MTVFDELNGKKVVVVGLGRSGMAAAKFLVEAGAKVWIADRRPEKELIREVEEMKGWPVQFKFGGHPASIFEDAALSVISPGVPASSMDTGQVPMIGELELASRYLSGTLVAITGTNGKSTTSALVGEILRAWGKHVFVGGNLGIPLCEAARSKRAWDFIVAEVSSFQLETIETFRPYIAVLLNVTPDHLNRYKRFEDYLLTKLRIFENQTPSHWAVVNFEEEPIQSYRSILKGRIVGISPTGKPSVGVWLEGDDLVSNLGGVGKVVHRSEIRLLGRHNLQNVMAAVAVCLLLECPVEVIRKGLGQFKGLEHRLEFIRRRRSVSYINDSKATTVAAVVCALESFSGRVVLIAGGQDKEIDFGPLRPVVLRRTKAVVLIGETRDKIQRVLEGTVPIHQADHLEEAVKVASGIARTGDVVLLAPGCASFDMFHDFEDRGRQFKDFVERLS